MQNKNGFTLIELIIVLSLSSIMLGLASVSFTSIERIKLKQTANNLCTKIRYCQRNALEEKREYGISFDKTDNKYYINYTNDTGSPIYGPELKLPSGIKFEGSTPSSIGYTKNGTIEQGGTIVLSSKNYFLNMTLNIGCGRVEIKQIQKLTKKIYG